MERFDWSRHIFRPTPDPPYETFAEDPFFGRVPEGMVHMPPVYYALATPWLRMSASSTTLLDQYRAARRLSVVFGLLTLWCLWAAVKQLTGSGMAAGSVTAMLALHPQFLLMATAVNPDALVNLFGAIVFWQVARLADDRQPHL